jgi:hypothetical protein
MGITRLMPGIDKFSGLADLDRALRFVQDLGNIFKKIEVSRMALVHFQITSVAGPDNISVIIYGSRQVLGSSLISGIAEYMSYSGSELTEVF